MNSVKKGKIIGGEFDISPQYLEEIKSSLFQDGYLFSSGRVALLEILTFLQNKNQIVSFYFPDYLCSSIVEVAEHISIKCNFFHLNQNFTIDRETFEVDINAKSAILLINYHGLCDVEGDVAWIKENFPKVIIIIDNVQAYFEMNKPTQADFTFTSFRKTFPVPDGSWVKTSLGGFSNNNHDFSCFVFYKLIGGLVKNNKNHSEVSDDIYLKLFKEGELILESDYQSKSISPFSLNILNNVDIEQIRIKRIENALYVVRKLKENGINPLFDLVEGKVPLFISISLPNRDLIRRKLFENNIFCPIHWPIIKYHQSLKMGLKMQESELSLIIDQRYGVEDMEKIIDLIFNEL